MPQQDYTDIKQVPWLRRSNSCNLLILLTVITFGFFPGILIIAIIVMTGDVYFKEQLPNGTLKKWGAANKAVAYVIVTLWLLYILSAIFG